MLLPFSADGPYDLVDARDGSFVRVQCKTARLTHPGLLVVNSFGTDHGRGAQSSVRRADVFGVFCPALDRVFMVPVADTARSKTSLQLARARNIQERGIRYADDYDVAARVSALGRAAPAVAA